MANSALYALLTIIISYPTSASEIIVLLKKDQKTLITGARLLLITIANSVFCKNNINDDEQVASGLAMV